MKSTHASIARAGVGRSVFTAALVALSALAAAQPCPTTLGPKLVGEPAVGRRQLGDSLSMSGDGGTLAAGAMWDRDYAGSVYIFRRTGGIWAQQGPILTPEPPHNLFGQRVALSGDGNTLLVSGSIDCVYVFVRENGEWIQQGPRLEQPQLIGFGTDVSLSFDGSTALIGAEYDNDAVGSAFVYNRTAGVWTQQGPRLAAPVAVPGSFFGCSADLSGDGSTAVIGAFMSNYEPVGAVYIFTRIGDTWVQDGPALVAPGQEDRFGYRVAISREGRTIIAGCGTEPAQTVYAFVRTESGWVQQGPRLHPEGTPPGSDFGDCLAIDGAGRTALIGAPRSDVSTGRMYIYQLLGGEWAPSGPPVLEPSPAPYTYFGYSVCLSDDGRTGAVSAHNCDNNLGAAYILNAGSGIVISGQPQDVSTLVGTDATFHVSAASPAGITYRWQFKTADLIDGPTGHGSIISGAATSTLTISALSLQDEGGYTCEIIDDCGTVASRTAELVVVPCPADFDKDGGVDGADVQAFFEAWEACDPSGDTNRDGGVDGADVEFFFTYWQTSGC